MGIQKKPFKKEYKFLVLCKEKDSCVDFWHLLGESTTHEDALQRIVREVRLDKQAPITKMYDYKVVPNKDQRAPRRDR